MVETQRKTMNVYIIHSVGKVGSTSIARALNEASLKRKKEARVFKTHVLNEQSIAAINQNNPATEPGHITQSKKFLELFRGDEIDQCYVIIGEREPVARAISVFFQNTTRYLKKKEVTMSDLDLVITELGNWAGTIIQGRAKWWKREVQDVFDIDAFAYDFDKRLGVTVIEPTEKITFVLYNLERGMQHLPEVLEEITGKKPIEIGVANTVADKKFFKPYQNHSEVERLYKEVVGSFKLPVPVLEEVYNNPVSRFFYDDEQIADFIERWREPA